MIYKILGNRFNPFFSLQDVAACPIFLLYRRHFFWCTIFEQVLELLIKSMLDFQGGVRRSAFVENLQGRAIMDGIHELVSVDVLAKSFYSSAVAVFFGN